MKKFIIIVFMMLLGTTAVGMYYKNSYTNIKFDDEEFLNEMKVNKCFSKSDFEKENTDSGENKTMWIINPETGEWEEIVTESVLEEEYKTKDEMIWEDLNNAECVFVVKPQGEFRNETGNIVQNVKVTDVLKGDKNVKDTVIQTVTSGALVNNEVEGYCIILETNYMKSGKEYLLFANETRHKNMYLIQNKGSVGYFLLEDTENIILKKNGLKYEEVKDNEFFVADEEALDIVLNIKEQVLKKYIK